MLDMNLVCKKINNNNNCNVKLTISLNNQSFKELE